MPAMQAGVEWQWSIRRKAAQGWLIGIVHLIEHPGDNRGFWLDPHWQGQGLMSEACIAATDFCFEVWGSR
jgi:RimJ/RimL family protein N-acetyltransferase